MAGTTRGKKKKPFTLRRFMKQSKRFLTNLARYIARGLYFGGRAVYRFLASLPPKILLVGSSAFGLLVIVIIIIAIASPNRRTSVDAAETLAAFNSGAGQPQEASNTYGMQPDGLYGDAQPADGLPADVGSIDPNAAASPDAAEPDTAEAETAEAEPAEVVFTEVKKGDDDPIISEIQTRLMELGYMDPDEPTEHFGPLTVSALAMFQRHNGLDDDGICGESTYAVLTDDDAKPYVMQRGDVGDDVTGVQQRLYELGYLDNKANITGNFGEKTEEAAKLFQKKNDLTSDGKVGEKTISMLYGEDVVSNSYRLGDENPTILACQQALKKLGYITFKPDGIMGAATVSAIKSFQSVNSLARNGCLGPETRDLLLSGDAEAKVIQLGDYGTDVKNVQERLIKLNYLTKGSATAYFGEITQKAIKAFQKRNSLTSDGKVGAVTLTLLNSSSARKASTPVNEKSSSSSGSSSSSSSGSSSSSSSGSSSSGQSSAVANSSGVEKMIALAESKIGSTYVRGGKGPNTFDCSGFVYWCMKNAGVSCSYQTSLMWRSCSRYTRINDMNSLARGDVLVFYGHVGLYIGNGKMIDASSSAGQVRKSSTVLKAGGYWKQNFICAYRIF